MLILFDDGVAEELDVDRVGDATWRLRQTPLATSSDIRRGDVLELQDEGKIHRLLCVVERSSAVTIELLIPKDGWTNLRELFEFVESHGGEWERAYGGVVLFHLPPQHADEARRRVAALDRPVE